MATRSGARVKIIVTNRTKRNLKVLVRWVRSLQSEEATLLPDDFRDYDSKNATPEMHIEIEEPRSKKK